MVKFALKSLFARKLRLALTSVAIVLGVAFVVSSFVVADSLRSTFDDLVEDIQGDVDLTIRTFQDFGAEQDRPPLDESLLSIVEDTDGVAKALPNVSLENVVPVKADGEPVTTFGPPMFGVNYSDDPLSQLILIDGRAPQGPDEFVMDIDTAEDEGFEIGQRYTIASPATENREFTLVGTVAFGDESNDLVGAVLTAYDLPTAQEFLGLEDKLTSIVVQVEPGVERSVVSERLQAALPDGIEVADRAVTVDEMKDDFGQISSIFGNILLAFAIITLVVSAFLINNTFQIVIGQRVRELALLRAIGATGSQVQNSVLIESLVVGVVSTVIGIGGGVLLSFGLRGLFDALGFDLPDGPIILAPRTIIIAIVVGVGVTMLASLAPARRARRVPPVAALRDDFQLVSASLGRRITVGTIVTVAGAVLMGWALFGDLDTTPLLIILSVGALAVFVGVNLLSPLVARPVALTLGTPVQGMYKTVGRLSRENAARNPRRTSSTAAALMIGLALVSMAGVVGDSIKKTFLDILGNAVTADFFVQPESGGFGMGGISPAYAQRLEERPEFDSVVEY
ncbi:MAG TPA: ABC transporter permease, partial [Acidimicrobiales bacterium]